MDETKREPSNWFRLWRWPRWVLIPLAVWLLAYPLGIGPALWLNRHGYMSPAIAQFLEIIYKPIGEISQTTIGKPTIGKYIDWWASD